MCRSLRCGQPDDTQGFTQAQWLDLVVAGRGGVNERSHIASDISALHGNFQGTGEDAVNLEHGSWCQALSFQPGIEALDVFGSKPVQTMLAKAKE